MSKHDLFWLAIKLAGLYLLVEGVLGIPLVIAEGGLENQMSAYVPLAVGGILLGIRLRPVDPAIDGQARALVPLPQITRGDCFWLVCKALGLWFAVEAVTALPFVIMLFEDWSRRQAVVMLGVPVRLAVALWLLFTNTLPDAVTRRGAARASASVEAGRP